MRTSLAFMPTLPRAMSAALLMLPLLCGAATASPEVDACAAVAASPFEAGRKATGVRSDLIDFDAAIPVCEAAVAADPASTDAKAWLARLYSAVGRSDEALPLAEAAAEAGNPLAQTVLGVILWESPETAAEAIALFEQAAASGYAPALNNIGHAYATGDGVALDSVKAVEFYALAADKDFGPAQNNLGVMYTYGEGVTVDYVKALELYRQAAENGDATAFNNIGVAYEDGEGVEIDYALAIEWYTRAAEAGVLVANTNLAELHLRGEGVEQDYAEGRRLAELAAEAGNDRGQFLLGRIYEEGLGVPVDIDRAIAYYELAAAQGDEESAQKVKDLTAARQ